MSNDKCVLQQYFLNDVTEMSKSYFFLYIHLAAVLKMPYFVLINIKIRQSRKEKKPFINQLFIKMFRLKSC